MDSACACGELMGARTSALTCPLFFDGILAVLRRRLTISALTKKTPRSSKPGAHGAGLALGALGVVFGDIGTSPLYTLKECLHVTGGAKSGMADMFGILSLMFWTLILVVTVKYLMFVMRADHNGEGGIFALLALVPERFRTRPGNNEKVTAMALLAVVGASLLYGDGVITPAISVLSAVEGLKTAFPGLSAIVLPLTCAILIGLFSIQKRGTGDVERRYNRGSRYYIGHETFVAGKKGIWNRIPEAIFSYLNRNAVREERRYGMPLDQVVEIGAEIDL